MGKWSPMAYLAQLRLERREYGWKGLLRRQGWKPFAVFFVFYLVRDLVLYVFIPLAVIFGLRS